MVKPRPMGTLGRKWPVTGYRSGYYQISLSRPWTTPLQADVISYNASISCCDAAARWEEALFLLADLSARRLNLVGNKVYCLLLVQVHSCGLIRSKHHKRHAPSFKIFVKMEVSESSPQEHKPQLLSPDQTWHHIDLCWSMAVLGLLSMPMLFGQKMLDFLRVPWGTFKECKVSNEHF